MLRVYLGCTHVFEVGFLSDDEERSKSTLCPKCGRVVKVKKAFRLIHPPSSKRRWVEGERVL